MRGKGLQKAVLQILREHGTLIIAGIQSFLPVDKITKANSALNSLIGVRQVTYEEGYTEAEDKFTITQMGIAYLDSLVEKPPAPPPPLVSPKNKEPPRDPERECYGKKRYDEAQAEKLVRQILRDRGTQLRAYGCYICGGYHLTKRL